MKKNKVKHVDFEEQRINQALQDVKEENRLDSNEAVKGRRPSWRPMTFPLRVLYAIIFCLVLFIAQKGGFGQALYQFTERGLNYVFERQFNFAQTKKWVDDLFGSANLAFFLPNDKPEVEKVTEEVSARVITNFSETKTGVQIETHAHANVVAGVEGIVIFAGRKAETNQTIIIQSEDGTEYWYGLLEELKVRVYDPVVKGEVIGIAGIKDESSQYYFALKKGGKFIDPKQVLQLEG